MREVSSYTVEDLANPGIDAATLGQLASARPDLSGAILAHPNCYPELANWLSQGMQANDEQPPAPVPNETAGQMVTSVEHGSVALKQTKGDNLGMNEYQNPMPPTLVDERRKSLDPSVQQMSAGARQVAAGAKDYFANTVAPAAVGVTKSIQHTVNQPTRQSPASANWNDWVPFIVPVAAFIAIISLFLPVVSVSAFGYSMSANFFSEEVGGEGFMLLILMLAAIAFAVVSVGTRKKWARITARIVGIIAACSA